MTSVESCSLLTSDMELVRARAKVLAHEDRELKAELIRIRRDAGLTQKDVADRLGVTQQSIHKLERYESDPKSSTLRRYANAVGALVEHHVQTDRGQSVQMAAQSSWKFSSSSNSRPIDLGASSPSRGARSGWKGSNHAHFGLAT